MESTVFFGITNPDVLKPELMGVLPAIYSSDLKNLLIDSGDLDYVEEAKFTSCGMDTATYERIELIIKTFAESGYETGKMITLHGYNLVPVTIKSKKVAEEKLQDLEKKNEKIQYALEKYNSLLKKGNITVKEIMNIRKEIESWNPRKCKGKYTGLQDNILVLSTKIPENIEEPNDIFLDWTGSVSVSSACDLYNILVFTHEWKENTETESVTIYILADLMGECGNY